MTRAFGQSLSEYGLAIGLVVLMGIGGLSLLGSQTADLLGNMIGQKGRSEKNLATALSASSASSAFVLESGFEARSDAMDLTIPVTTLDGRKIQFTVKNYPTKITENDLLTGEDGGTIKLYAKLMQQLAQELFDKNVITEDQLAAYKNMGTAGFSGAATYNEVESDYQNTFKKILNDSAVDKKGVGYKNINANGGLNLLNQIGKIQKELLLLDTIEKKAGRKSNLVSAFREVSIDFKSIHENQDDYDTQKILPIASKFPPNSPLQALILDLSLKMKLGMQLPIAKYFKTQEEVDLEAKSLNPDKQTYKQLLEQANNYQKESIHTANLKQNSAKMCDLGKGTVDEAQVKCIPSLQ